MVPPFLGRQLVHRVGRGGPRFLWRGARGDQGLPSVIRTCVEAYILRVSNACNDDAGMVARSGTPTDNRRLARARGCGGRGDGRMRSHHKRRRAGRLGGAELSGGVASRSSDSVAGRSEPAGRPEPASRSGVPGRHGADTAGPHRIPGARRISDALGVPVDIALNMPRMNFEGNARLVLDNHRGLVEYTPSHLQIDTPAGQIDITGKRLRIRGISRDQIVADGWFDRVEFSGWVGNATAGSAGQEAP